MRSLFGSQRTYATLTSFLGRSLRKRPSAFGNAAAWEMQRRTAWIMTLQSISQSVLQSLYQRSCESDRIRFSSSYDFEKIFQLILSASNEKGASVALFVVFIRWSMAGCQSLFGRGIRLDFAIAWFFYASVLEQFQQYEMVINEAAVTGLEVAAAPAFILDHKHLKIYVSFIKKPKICIQTSESRIA